MKRTIGQYKFRLLSDGVRANKRRVNLLLCKHANRMQIL